MADVKICSFNVRGIGEKTKRADIFNYLRKLNFNICCLQDTHSTLETEKEFKNDWGDEIFFSHGSSNSRGTTIMFKKNFEYHIKENIVDPNGNYVGLNISMLNTDITLINVYGPNADKPEFYHKIRGIIDCFQNASVILCGDWNLVQDYNLDTRFYKAERNIKAKQQVLNIKKDYELNDPWRINNPNTHQFTWFQKNPVKMSRLDFFLVSNDIPNLLYSTSIKPGYRSDHSIVCISLKANDNKKGHGFWKMNTSLLEDKNYVKLIKDLIRENVHMYAQEGQDPNNFDVPFNISDQLFFETLKMEIRKISITYSSKLKRERENNEKNLVQRIETMEKDLVDMNKSDVENLEKLKNSLETIRQSKMKGIILRSKVQWVEEGEKPTKYFASLERKNYTCKLINKLNVDNNIIEAPDKILQEVEKYYKNLYDSKIKHQDPNIINEFLKDDLINKLTPDQRELCEGNIREHEVKDALKNAKNKKSPGPDGIPVDFYKFFWSDLGVFCSDPLGQLSVKAK